MITPVNVPTVPSARVGHAQVIFWAKVKGENVVKTAKIEMAAVAEEIMFGPICDVERRLRCPELTFFDETPFIDARDQDPLRRHDDVVPNQRFGC